MTPTELVTLGLDVSLSAFALGIVTALVASMFLGVIEWARRILGR